MKVTRSWASVSFPHSSLPWLPSTALAPAQQQKGPPSPQTLLTHGHLAEQVKLGQEMANDSPPFLLRMEAWNQETEQWGKRQHRGPTPSLPTARASKMAHTAPASLSLCPAHTAELSIKQVRTGWESVKQRAPCTHAYTYTCSHVHKESSPHMTDHSPFCWCLFRGQSS